MRCGKRSYMRVNVKKYLFIGSEEQKEHFFKKAQNSGFIHFIDTRTVPAPKEIPTEIQKITSAIKILRHYPPVDQEENPDLIRTGLLVDEILELNEKNEKLLEDIRVISVEMNRVGVFGNFNREDLTFIEKTGKNKIQFFAGRPNLFVDQPEPEGLIFIASEHNLNYYVAINPHPVSYEKLAEIKIEKTFGELQKEYQQALHQQRDVEHQLKAYTKYKDLLHHYLVARLNKYNLHIAQAYVQDTMEGAIFAIEGWVPENKIYKINELTEGLSIYFEEIAVEPKDVIPTHLENEGVGRVGEDLINIYDTPSYTDKDPSIWVLASFTLFFSFIIADAGYGLIFLLLAYFLKYKYPSMKKAGKRAIKLMTILGWGCLVWGIITNAFFGIAIDANNPVRKLSVLHWLAEKKTEYHFQHKDDTYEEWLQDYPALANVKDSHELLTFRVAPSGEQGQPILHQMSDNILFEMALFIGIVHILFSLGRYSLRHVHNIGWMAFLIGAYLYFPVYLGTPSLLNFAGGIDFQKGGEFGFHLMIGGIIFAVIMSIYKYGVTGIFELAVVIQVFADILSYLRLYALGLAATIVSATINEVAGKLPLVFAILIILVAHFVNIILGVMSGVIHGLRLNFIEWYHYSFEGGGKIFKPLKLLKID